MTYAPALCGGAARRRNAAAFRLLGGELAGGFRGPALRAGRGGERPYHGEGRDGCTVAVSEPEALAGISARITDGGTEIEYGSMVLAAGDMNGAGLSAVTALPRLAEAIGGAHASLSWTEGDESVVSLVPSDSESVELRLGADGMPLSAEFTGSGGEVLIMCEIREFSLTATED